MELANDHRYVLLLFGEDGASLGYSAVDPDWEPVAECTRFRFQRSGDLPLENPERSARIAPVWDRADGEPLIRGFRISLVRNGAKPVSSDFTTAYFRRFARIAGNELVDRGKLKRGDRFHYRVAAFAREQTASGTGEDRDSRLQFLAHETEPPLSLTPALLGGYLETAAPQDAPDADDMPVFIPRVVLVETEAHVRANPEIETGGVLIGSLCHDASRPELFTVVSAQIPAEHTVGDATKLTFTAQTWASVDAAIRLRHKGEIAVGYWHSHPLAFWCKNKQCDEEKRRHCSMANGFFSEDDELVMRAAFPRAYNVGLVVTDAPSAGANFSLFGWRDGGIERRGFHVIEGGLTHEAASAA